MGRRIVSIMIGGMYPDIRAEWVVAALDKEIQLELKVVSSNRAKFVNWWEYGMELYLSFSLKSTFVTSKT